MDNRVFNVNGSGLESLRQTMALAFNQESLDGADAWVFDPDKGLVLLWCHVEGSTKFPVTFSADQAARVAFTWLDSPEAKAMKLEDWDANHDHDGSNSRGWRVYVEDWGHVGKWHESLCAVRPAFMWHGK